MSDRHTLRKALTVAHDSTQYIIIGAGLFGTAAAWRLAQSGKDVIILERSIPASDSGSSHGSARIFRYPYMDQPTTSLVKEARTQWNELEATTEKRLITPSGCLDTGSVRNPEHLANLLILEGIEHELLDAASAQQRWPQFNFSGTVLWHPGAGVINAGESVAAMNNLAISAGAHLRCGWEVESVTSHGTGYRVTSTTGDTVEGEQVIVASGGWLPKLLGNLQLPQGFLERMPEIQVRQENAYHFYYRDTADWGETPLGNYTSWPCLISKEPGYQGYALPGGGDAGFRGQKVAEYNGGRVIRNAGDQNGVIDAANRHRVIDFVKANCPGLDPTPYAETTCIFTSIPDDRMIIDRAEGITIVSACSGQGAKFAPLIGSTIYELVTGTSTSQPRELFRAHPQRFLQEA